MMEKKDIRKTILQSRQALSKEEVYQKSNLIFQTLKECSEYRNAELLYLYMDFKNEVMTRDIIEDAYKLGKKIAIPKIEENEMHFYYLEQMEDAKTGYFGIREPKSLERVTDSQGIMITPGIAFDLQGYRIGYGKGFYDRYLHTNPVSKKIAIAFEVQIVEAIPYDTHDIPMNIIITEDRTIIMD